MPPASARKSALAFVLSANGAFKFTDIVYAEANLDHPPFPLPSDSPHGKTSV